jgi:hypothetical protein
MSGKMEFFGIGITAFVVMVVVSRMILHKANSKLSAEQKAKLVDLSGGWNAYGIVVVLPLIGIYWYLTRYTDFPVSYILFGYLSLSLAVIALLQFAHYRRVARLDFPAQYITKYVISRFIYLVGVILFFSVVAHGIG